MNVPNLYYHSLIGLLTRFTDDECIKVSGPAAQDEVRDAVSALKTDKAPQPDVLGLEFYQDFSGNLAPAPLDVFKATYDIIS